MKKKILLFSILIILNSCNSLKEAGQIMRNEKVRTTDEFLVKKRNPLVLPPDFEKIPEPGSTSKKKEEQDDKIKKILKTTEIDTSTNKSSSVEESILDRIRK